MPASNAPEPLPSLAPLLAGGTEVTWLQGGDTLFPAMCEAIAAARHQVWLGTYIFHDDAAAHRVVQALADAARRGVWVGVVVDGFGSKATLPVLRQLLNPPTESQGTP